MVNSKLLQAFHRQKSVCTDTRKIKPGDLFFALKGPNFNGNRFAEQALNAGAAYAVVDEVEYCNESDPRYILEEDGLTALQELAREVRRSWNHPVIGITGTNGKTTTKELCQAVLSSEKKVWTTQGNLNNHIGVPLTLLAKPEDVELIVVEMGANKLGDIAELCAIAEPTHGMITNIGEAHLERFGDVDGVEKTKGEMYDSLRSHGGCGWVNLGDHRVARAASGLDCFTTYGSDDADLRLLETKLGLKGTEITVQFKSWEAPETFTSHLMGAHNVPNMLAAIVVGIDMGISVEGIRRGLASYIPANNRTQLIEKEKYSILLDAYNANPSSMRAAIQSCFAQHDGKVGLVLGDMFELGPNSYSLHGDLGEFLNQFVDRIGFLILMGEDMKAASGKCLASHMLHTTDLSTAAMFLKENLEGTELVLIKGSRGMALERILPLLEES